MDCYDLVVVGGSAGSLTPLRAMISALPSDLPVPVAITIHVPAQAHSRLPKLLSRTAQLPARHGENGDQLCAGTIYIAPPNRHMLITRGMVALSPGPHIRRLDLPPEFQHRPLVGNSFLVQVGATLEEVEHALIARTIATFKGNKTRAAKALGISLRTLYNRLAHKEEDQTG